MLADRNSRDLFPAAPAESVNGSAQKRVEALMTAGEWAALSRLSTGDWISEVQITRLTALGLAEIVFGRPLLTRLGRATLAPNERS
jgi:hypothetical protein